MGELKKIIDQLKTEVVGLKIRLTRVERYIEDSPDPKEYIEHNDDTNGDVLFDEAKITVQSYDMASASLLQRKLSIGYARAARLLDLLEEAGIVAPGEESKPRKVLLK